MTINGSHEGTQEIDSQELLNQYCREGEHFLMTIDTGYESSNLGFIIMDQKAIREYRRSRFLVREGI